VSRRKPPSHHWHVGDSCQVLIVWYLAGRERSHWQDAEVVAVRGDRVVVRRGSWESVHPCWELREKPKPLGNAMARLVNRFGHDRHRRTV